MYCHMCACMCTHARVCVHVHMQMVMPMYSQPLSTIPSTLPQNIPYSISVASCVVNSLQVPVFDYILNSNIQISFACQVSLEVHQLTTF